MSIQLGTALGKTGHTEATAHITQHSAAEYGRSISKVRSPNTSLFVQKDPESGRPVLHYLYNNEPKQGIAGDHQRHVGAATLKVGINNDDELTGNYFTDRATKGHYTMLRSAATPKQP